MCQRDGSFDILVKNSAAICPWLKSLPEAKVKRAQFMALTIKVTKQFSFCFVEMLESLDLGPCAWEAKVLALSYKALLSISGGPRSTCMVKAWGSTALSWYTQWNLSALGITPIIRLQSKVESCPRSWAF